jgi:hypothetical protein
MAPSIFLSLSSIYLVDSYVIEITSFFMCQKKLAVSINPFLRSRAIEGKREGMSHE